MPRGSINKERQLQPCCYVGMAVIANLETLDYRNSHQDVTNNKNQETQCGKTQN